MNIETLTRQIEAYQLTACMIHQYGELKYVYEQFPYASEELLPINSCTKSVLSALICIAMEKGLFPAPERLVIDYFPEFHKQVCERKRQITIEHLLTMSAGFSWSEFGSLHSFPKMTRSANWIQFVWNQPIVDEPGTKWVYNSGLSQMLAGILKQAVGMPISHFAEQYLFSPLGIDLYVWKQDPQGIHTGGFGLKLTAVDLLKFGLLYLQRGNWNGQTVITETLVDRSVLPAINVAQPERGYYGWHWWVDVVSHRKRLKYYYARGYGGQFVFIVPDYEAVVITTRKKTKKGLLPHHLFRQHIAPVLVNS